jgi:hypothetical protein
MTKDMLRWLEAAYLYYLHPEHGETMDNYEWDALGKKLEKSGQIKEAGSLFQMQEEDYPQSIRKKYE